MAKNLADLWKEAGKLEKEGEDVAEFNESVTKLPYQLKDEFRQRQDPKLDEQINRLQSDTFGAAIKGLDMYQNISNPFNRRSLAEMYQGGIESQWKNAVDERTRRQGVFSDYIEKWTGLFGAEAARKQQIFQNKQSTWDREKNLADTEESNRRWEIENARAAKSSSSKGDSDLFWEYAQNELASSVGEDGKYDPKVYERIRSEAKNYKINKDSFDKEMSYGLGEREYGNLGIGNSLSSKQRLDNMEADNKLKEYEYIKSLNVKNQNEADDGDNYWNGTKVNKKKKGWFGWDILARDPEIYQTKFPK